MESFNRVELLGRLGKDPEIKYTSSGIAIANFSLATSKPKKKRDGGFDSETTWHNCVAWRKNAENMAELSKGDRVYVAGEIKQESWDTDQGKRYAVKINCITVLPTTSQSKKGAGRGGPGKQEYPESSFEDDIPF